MKKIFDVVCQKMNLKFTSCSPLSTSSQFPVPCSHLSPSCSLFPVPRSLLSRGFTLVEMLVVMGILGILMGVGLTSFSGATKRAQKAKAQVLVSNVATALTALYQKDDAWPPRLANGGEEGELDEKRSYILAKRGFLSLSYKDSGAKTTGLDQLGLVSPWATDVIKRKGGSGVSVSTKVPTGGTIQDHRLRFAVDTEGNGFVTASVGGESVRIRAVAAVWCAGRDGKMEAYSKGLKSDDVYSWSRQQVVK